MQPAFSSTRNAAGFGLVVALCVALPMMLPWIGLPTREQAFSTLPTAAGPVGMIKHLIYDDDGRADVLVVGSSLIKEAIQAQRLAQLLSRDIGHPMRVAILELNWYGADQQYFMLKDYLARHGAPGVVVLHLPQVRAFDNRPHPQAYRWLRYSELPELPHGFPLLSRLQLYGEMVLGAPRQLLSKMRTNRMGPEAVVPPYEVATGRGGGSPDGMANAATEAVPPASLLAADSPLFQIAKPALTSKYRFALGPYNLLFLKRIGELVRSSGSHLVLIHVPLGLDPLSGTVQELEPWGKVFWPDIKIIAVPKNRLFQGVDASRFFFPSDNHMNQKGSERFTDSVHAAVANAYLGARADRAEK